MEIIVSDSSPLIALLNIDQLDLLKVLFTKIIVPKMVAEEIECREADDSPWFTLKKTGFIHTEELAEDNRLALLKLQLDAGESEAILLAEKHHLPLLIDERAGRNMAKSMGLEIVGLVGVLYALKQNGKIKEGEMISLVEALEQVKFRMSVGLKELLLAD